MRIFSFLALVFMISAALAASDCTTSTSYKYSITPAEGYQTLKFDNRGGYEILVQYEESTTNDVEVSAVVCNNADTANAAFTIENHPDGYVSLVLAKVVPTAPPTEAPTTTTTTTKAPTQVGNDAGRINPLSSLFVLILPMFFVNRRLSIIFAVLAALLCLQMSHAESASTQITVTIRLPKSMKHACTSDDLCTSIHPAAQYLNADGAQLRKYIALDGTSPYSTTADKCQIGFHTMPAGWTLATEADLEAIEDSGAFPTTKCLVGDKKSVGRQGDECNAVVTKKTMNGQDYFGIEKCGRIILAADSGATVNSFDIGMKIAIIADCMYTDDNRTADGGLILARTMLIATGIPYEIISLKDDTKAGTPLVYASDLPLFDEEGVPKFYGIVVTSANVRPLLNAHQTKQLDAYMKMYKVREVNLNIAPNVFGMVAAPSVAGTAKAGSTVKLDATWAADNDYAVKGLNHGEAEWSIATFFSSPYTISGGVSTVKPFLRLLVSGNANTYYLGSVVTMASGLEVMQFAVGNSLTIPHGPAVSNVWINWVTRGVWVGSRRIFLSPQIDDLFLSTEQYGTDDKVIKRMSALDLETTLSYLNNRLNATAPPGSNITLEFGFNNAEAEISTADKGKPELTLRNKVQDLHEHFFWESHTYEHLDLTCPESNCTLYGITTEAAADYQLAENDKYTRDVLFKNFGGLDTPTYSRDCMITPKISGLLNANALRALKKNGYTCVVGDNSVKALQQENPYLGEWTTKEKHGEDGIFIIPRYATEIYYDCSLEEYQVAQFNARYGPGGIFGSGPELDLEGIMMREAVNTMAILSKFRHDPYMFHQGNLYHFEFQRTGDSNKAQWALIELWLDHVVKLYVKTYTFPIITTAHKWLRDQYMARREREFCGIDAKISIVNGVRSTIEITSTGTCEAAVTGVSACTSVLDTNCRTEQYGPDNTVWSKVKKNQSASMPASGAW